MAKFPAPSYPYVQARHSGGKQTPTLLVMHSTVTTTAEGAALGVANMWHGSRSPVTSAHYVVDEAKTYQCVYDHTVAYHCGYNDNSIGIEMCDEPDPDSKARWETPAHKAMFDRVTTLAAELCLAYSIPVRFLTDDELRAWGNNKTAKNGGIVTHAQMSRVFKKSTHWDPGAWPTEKFLEAVQIKVKEKNGTGVVKPPVVTVPGTPFQKRAAAALAALAIFAAAVLGIAKGGDNPAPKPPAPVVHSSQSVDVFAWNEKSFPRMSSAFYTEDFNKVLSMGGKRTVYLHSEMSAPNEVAIFKAIAAKKNIRHYGVRVGGDTAISTKGLPAMKIRRIQISNDLPAPISPIRHVTAIGRNSPQQVVFISMHLSNRCFPKEKNKPWYPAQCRALNEQVKLMKQVVSYLTGKGFAVVLGGDQNISRTITWGKNQVAVRFGLVQLTAIPSAKVSVRMNKVQRIRGLHTDHAITKATITFTQRK